MPTGLILLALCGLAADAGQNDADEDKANLQGFWQAIAVQAGGKWGPADFVKKVQLQIDGDRLILNPNWVPREHTFVLHPQGKPKAMDLTPWWGPQKGKLQPNAIYELDGDLLMLCIDNQTMNPARPSEFKSTAGDTFFFITYERVNDLPVSAASPANAP